MKNKLIYLGFIIGIIIIIFILIYNYKEPFVIPITFLTKEETTNFILKDEDNYIKNLTIFDLRARKVGTNDEYLYKSARNTLEFTQEQKDKLTICANEAITYFNNNFNWIFALMSNEYEDGYPHTRANIIFISPSIINYDNTELIKTLIHESIHIYQRYNKTKIDEYLISNGFNKKSNRYISKIEDYDINKCNNNSNSNKNLIRANPDLDEFIYTDKDGIEMASYYNSEYPNGINDATSKSTYGEHPFEYMAYTIAGNYSKKILENYKNTI
jgi:hypothetical protein